MEIMIYDGSFQGWLTAVFELYERKLQQASIIPSTRFCSILFGETREVITDERKAIRLWSGLTKYLSVDARMKVFRAFLSELPRVENQLLAYVRYAIGQHGAEHDFGHPAVLFVEQTARKVYREKHRMEAFVRFRKAADNLFTAVVEPDFNVLPLIRDHFEKRYADQRWMIMDLKRKYGLYYDGEQTVYVEPGDSDRDSCVHIDLDSTDEAYSNLWCNYFSSVNIRARKNQKLHLRHMPKRYWKYLPEKGA